MKRTYAMAAGLALLAMTVAAQDTSADKEKMDKMKLELERMLSTSKIMAARGGVMGTTVKAAPYSGQEINETTQVLGDGTRIHNESRATVYRDSEGRVRRETGDHVTIWDPVANTNLILNTKNMTAFKTPMGAATFTRALAAPPMAIGAGGRGGFAGTSGGFSVKDDMVTVTRDGKTETFPVGPDGTWVSDDGKMRGVEVKRSTASASASGVISYSADHVAIASEGKAVPVDFLVGEKIRLESMAMAPPTRVELRPANVKTDALGDQVIEGVKARGSRQTTTIQAGAIGNDRPLNTISERWFSDDLQMEVMTRRSDPRTGEQTFRLVNINRSEPAAYLFQVPSGYTVNERK